MYSYIWDSLFTMPMERTQIKVKREWLLTRLFFCLQHYIWNIWKIRVKKLNIFKDIELENLNSINIFFRFTKVQYFVYALTWHGPILKKKNYLGELDTLKR